MGPNLLLKLVFSRFEVQFLVEMVKLIVKNMRRPIKSSKFWEERLPLNWYVNGSRLCQNKSRIYFFTMKLAQKYSTNLEEIAWHISRPNAFQLAVAVAFGLNVTAITHKNT